ncbi:MAG: hypothetical protein WDN00_02230 [Limisphaerales bacterium]
MNPSETTVNPLSSSKSLLYAALAIVCFQIAYTSTKYPWAGLFIFGYAYGLVRLTDQSSVRRAFYFGLATGFLSVVPQAGFFWTIFGPAAIVLWLVFAFWIGLFTATSCGCIRRWGKLKRCGLFQSCGRGWNIFAVNFIT